jgi:hypothetical protein
MSGAALISFVAVKPGLYSGPRARSPAHPKAALATPLLTITKRRGPVQRSRRPSQPSVHADGGSCGSSLARSVMPAKLMACPRSTSRFALTSGAKPAGVMNAVRVS